MKCGHCKRNDPGVNVAHVRSCDGRQSFDAPPAGGPFNSNKLNAIHRSIHPDDRQTGQTALLDPPAPNRRRRRDDINADIRKAAEAVPPGRYGLRNADGEWRFYQVDKPTLGEWAGWAFISRLASEERHPVKGLELRLALLLAIGVDPEEAAKAYGRETKHCSQCHRLLTNPRSIEVGVGEQCAANMGWEY